MSQAATTLATGALLGVLGAIAASIITLRASRRAAQATAARAFEAAAELRRIQERTYSEEASFRRLLPELIERIPEEVLFRVTQEFSNREPDVTNISAEAFHVYQVDTSSERARLIQEIAHSLRTPLAQIEAAAISIELRGHAESAAIQRIRSGVEICKCFISAYRNHGRVQEKVGNSPNDSNSKILESAIEFYREASNKTLSAELHDIPASLSGYSNDFVIAVLLPLLENAVEASPEGDKVSLEFTRDQHFANFIVTNTFTGNAPGVNVFDRGYTTKSNHQGVGLSVSKGLIEGFAGGELKMDVENKKVKFTVSLPSAR
ncbi:sensor histidine kinase [Streptomyces sp. Mo3]|uniref:sensor histidine kinase n=1 Tax=Streptomyces sp. Mo3 TaxID=3161190 RepID=UPI0039F031BC